MSHRDDDTLLSGVGKALEVMVVAVAVGVALLAVVIPRLGGATPYDVRTGSMRPEMPPGTLVVVRPVDAAELEVGDVVTFMPRPDDTSVVTHRIVGQGLDMAGRPVHQTQGDASDARDPGVIRAEQIVGERWYAVPYVGHLTAVLTGRERQGGVLLTAGGLLLYASVMFLGAFRDRVRRPPGIPAGARHA